MSAQNKELEQNASVDLTKNTNPSPVWKERKFEVSLCSGEKSKKEHNISSLNCSDADNFMYNINHEVDYTIRFEGPILNLEITLKSKRIARHSQVQWAKIQMGI